MLFSDFLPRDVLPKPKRLALLDTLLVDFEKAFPDLRFELRLDRRVVNAQAILLDGKRCVLIYGGIVLHPGLAHDSLTFVVLHEAGHHLARGARLPFNPSLACECVSDHWAAGDGAEILYRKTGRQFQISKAVIELENLLSTEQQFESAHPEKHISNCWNRKWLQRRNALENLHARSPSQLCELMGSK